MNKEIYYIIDGYGKVESYYYGGCASKLLCYIDYKLLSKNKRKVKLYNGFYLRKKKIIELLEENNEK